MKKILYNASVAIFSVAVLTGCSDFFDPSTETGLDGKDYISDYSELEAGYRGLIQTTQPIMEKSIYLEGLRSDFLEPTSNATVDFWDVYYYNDHRLGALKENDLANPVGYYNVILNANDYLYKAKEWIEENPNGLDEDVLRAFVGGGLRYKAWAYLMLAKIYGEAYYIDDPLIKYQDISKFPLWGIDDILTKCIDLIEGGITIGNRQFDGIANMDWARYVDQTTTNPDQLWNRYCPYGQLILGECYLWKESYSLALYWLSEAINQGQTLPDPEYMHNSDTRSDGSRNYWTNSFRSFYRLEQMSGASYDLNLQQTNNLRMYLGNRSDNYFYLRASEASVQRWLDNNDTRRGAGFTYSVSGSDYIVSKYGSGSPESPLAFIASYRSGHVYMMLIECLIQQGRFEAAELMMNGRGLATEKSDFHYFLVDGSYAGSILEGLPPRMGQGRKASSANYAYMGFRSHVSMPSIFMDVLATPNVDQDEDKMYMDSLTIEERMMEFAGESNVYYAMLRNIRRWPASKYRSVWAEKIAAKYETGGEYIKSLLEADDKNWFIKYDLNN